MVLGWKRQTLLDAEVRAAAASSVLRLSAHTLGTGGGSWALRRLAARSAPVSNTREYVRANMRAKA